jgi:hypothetical protein
VFVSSTMLDLANERAEVVAKLEEFNFLPVNAERLSPTGVGSWARLEAEITSSDIFVLILGETYGWIPPSGPMAARQSVTELEFQAAREAGIPILVFTKRLGARPPADPDDAARRDAFRRRVEDWDGGYFRADFDLARDLATKVGSAVVALVSDGFRSGQLRLRRAEIELPPGPTEQVGGVVTRAADLPESLVDAVRRREVVLLLGAGASLAAGLPSAAAFIDAMVAEIRRVDPEYRAMTSGTMFNAVATDFVSLFGDEPLQHLAARLVDPFEVSPTTGHRIAAGLFDAVVTTNYDLLLDRALDERNTAGLRHDVDVIKLHGSIDSPKDLVLTERELARIEQEHPQVWESAVGLLRSRPLVSIGSSLRDPSLIRLLEQSRPELRGWVLAYRASEAERRRLAMWNLEPIAGDANGFLLALQHAVHGTREG